MKRPMVEPRPPHHPVWTATRLLLMLMCLAILPGCGQSTPPRTTSSTTVNGTSGTSPDHVHIVVTSVESLPLGTWMTVIFDQQVSQEANAIYRQLTSGTDVAGKVMRCPNEPSYETYYRYVLTFSRGGTRVATATDDARGCGVFTIEHLGGSTAYVFWANDQEQCFWDYLRKLVHAPEPVNLDTGTLCSAENAVRSESSSNWTEY
jgi:hypothetical protein